MTEQIGSHGLSCLSLDDYAAFALAMQCNAQATDAALAAQLDAFTAATGSPWTLAFNSLTRIIDDSTGFGIVGPGNLVGDTLRPGANPATTTTLSSPNYTQSLVPPSNTAGTMPPGIWFTGTSINWTLGAATGNSARQLFVYGVDYINGVLSAPFGSRNLFRTLDFQGDGGLNGALTSTGLLDTRSGNVGTLEAFFTHTNTAGDLTVAPANWRVWAIYMGTGLTF